MGINIYVAMLFFTIVKCEIGIMKKIELGEALCDRRCLNGFIRKIDRCTFTCKVTLNAKPTLGTSVRFQIMNKLQTVIDEHDHLDLFGECLEPYSSLYRCRKVDENVFNISYSVEVWNKEKIRCKLHDFISNEQLFPATYEPSDVNGQLKVNGLNISTDEYCHTTITSKDLFLEFHCISLALPCLIDIRVNHQLVVNKSKNSIYFNTTFENDVDLLVTIMLATCRSDGPDKIVNCTIHSEFNDIYMEVKNENNLTIIIPSVLSIPVVGLIILLVIFIIRRRKLRTNKRREFQNKNEFDTDVEQPLNLSQNTRDLLEEAKNGRTKIVTEEIFENKEDFNVTDKCGKSPLMLASENGQIEIVKLLLERGVERNLKDSQGDTALTIASANGKTEIAEMLIQNGAQINLKGAGGKTPLICASRSGHKDTVVMLLKNNANICEKDNKGDTALTFASGCGKTEVAKILIASGAKVNVRGSSYKTPLIFACTYRHTETAKMLIDNDADINVQDINKDTPLIIASRSGYTDTVKMLLESGAQVDIKDKQGDTPLIIACRYGFSKITDLLIQSKADINIKDSSGNNPLIIATERKLTKTIEILLQNNADIDEKGRNDENPLIIASRNGHYDVVKILIEKRAKINIKDKKGDTALIIANRYGFSEISEMLIASEHTD